MAIVRMKKMKLVGLSKEKELILDVLNKCGCCELKDSEEIENTHTRLNTNRLTKTAEKLSKLSFGIDFLTEQKKERILLAKKEQVEYVPPKKPLVSVRKEVDFDQFIGSNKEEFEIFANIDSLEKIEREMVGLRSESVSLYNKIATFISFDGLDISMNDVKSTKNTTMYIGSVPENAVKVIEEINQLELATAVTLKKETSALQIFVVCHKDISEEVGDLLNQNSFVRTNIESDSLPVEEIEKAKERILEIGNELIALNGDAMNKFHNIEDFELLFDYYSYKQEKIEAQGTFMRTERELAVAFEAWVPKDKCDFVKDAVLEKTNFVEIEFHEPQEGEMPPTLTNNGTVVKAFESITNMYSTPSYYERDPNFSVMIFFTIFFGFMVSDAGYGLLLAVAGFTALKFLKFENSLKSMVIIFALGGLSTVFWGLLFGGVFSIEISGTIFEKFYWFSPLDNPIGVLGLSVGLGILQILYGMVMKAILLIQRGRALDAILDVGSWFVLFTGIGLFAGSLIPGFEGLADVGKYTSIAGVLMLVLTQGRGEKGLFKKIFKGVGSLYGLMNYLSDILSYLRLFGLGLATGVIGMVFNTIGGVFIELIPIPVVGHLIAIAFILIGHAMNIGLALLGAYVHDCRLQFIEYFGKFYEGEGRDFKPLGSNTKYVKIKQIKNKIIKEN